MEPDYGAELPLWGDGFGNIAWQYTKFPPELLDRLAAWQRAFDAGYHWDRGWKPGDTRHRWVAEGKRLAADVREELGTRATLVLGPWSSGGR